MEETKKSPNLLPKNPLIIFVVIWAGLLLAQYFLMDINGRRVPYSELMSYVSENQITEATIQGDQITAKIISSEGEEEKINSVIFDQNELAKELRQKNIKLWKAPESNFWSNFFYWFLLFYVFYFLWRFFSPNLRKKIDPLFSMGQSKARIFAEKDIKIKFSDVAGVDEAKQELLEVVNFLKDKKKYSRLGGRSPKGILLVGPPGTGKTLVAKAVAGEASVPFYSINGSEFVELFVGMGAARVRDLFSKAKKSAPCIIFIDELDALGRARGPAAGGGGHDEKEQTLNQLLAELDGFDSREGIILLAATNRPAVLDPALLRAGRFDRQVLLDNPDFKGREAILKIHIKNIIIDKEIDLGKVAGMTPGFSGADLANLVNEAALVATRKNSNSVKLEDFTQAIERIVAGLERRSRIMTGEEKKRVAFHEMGHASVSLAMSKTSKVHKISIIPRGMGALGYTFQRPTEDRYLATQGELSTQIAILLGGYTSEEIHFNEISSGASDDLAKATEIARAMVIKYGMSKKVGLASYSEQGQNFLSSPQGIFLKNSISEDLSALIDHEVNQILVDCKVLAKKSILENRNFIESSVTKLIKKETLEEGDLKSLWGQFGVKFQDEDEKNNSK